MHVKRHTPALRAALFPLVAVAAWTMLPQAARAAPASPSPPATASAPRNPKAAFGFRVSLGGRYDKVRMCVATPAEVPGGPAFDVSFYMEFRVGKRWSLSLDIPVARPLLFGASFKMLQFEPELTFAYRIARKGKVDVILGPSLGVTLHYGPDYHSSASGSGRGESFFAMGPRIGGYFGLDFKRPGKTFNFQLGIRPYVTPLFGVNDPADHVGVVVGGQLEALFRFSLF